MTSGSWRSTRRSAVGKSACRCPTSRWLTIDLLVGVEDLDRVLDGDDVARPRFSLMWSIIAATVVVLPEPAGPDTMTRPSLLLGQAADSAAAGRAIGDGRAPGTTRRTTRPTEPRWR